MPFFLSFLFSGGGGGEPPMFLCFWRGYPDDSASRAGGGRVSTVSSGSAQGPGQRPTVRRGQRRPHRTNPRLMKGAVLPAAWSTTQKHDIRRPGGRGAVRTARAGGGGGGGGGPDGASISWRRDKRSTTFRSLSRWKCKVEWGQGGGKGLNKRNLVRENQLKEDPSAEIVWQNEPGFWACARLFCGQS